MKRSKRLAVVLDLAEQTEKKAAEMLEAARKQMIDDQHKLDEVNNYIGEYEKEFMSGGAEIRVEEIIRQRGFLAQLADVKKQQIEVIKHRKHAVGLRREQWHAAHLKKKALLGLIEKCQQHESAVLNRAEEKMLDEWSLQSFNRKRTEEVNDKA